MQKQRRATSIASAEELAERSLILRVTEQLRASVNSGGCDTIYRHASQFFRSQSLPEWLTQCEQIIKKLGVWNSFTPGESDTCSPAGSGVVCLDGIATLAGTGSTQNRLEDACGASFFAVLEFESRYMLVSTDASTAAAFA